MKSFHTSLQKKNLSHLIKLLDDSDTEILTYVSNTIVNMGIQIIPALEEELIKNYDNKIISGNISQIIQTINFKEIRKALKKWLNSYEHDLLDALIIIDKFEYQQIEYAYVYDFIDKIYRDVWIELNDNLTPLEKIKVLNHILFDVYELKSDKENIKAPENHFISQLIKSRTGNSILLGIIYIIIARKIGLPVCGINLPMNFLVGYLNDLELKTNGKIHKFLFYIYPFENGKFLNNFTVEQYLDRLQKYVSYSKEDMIEMVTNRQAIYLLLNALSESYMKAMKEEKAKAVNQLLELF